MKVSPTRITVNMVNEARSLLAAGHSKRARRKLRHARRRLAGSTDQLERSARRLLGEAIGHLVDHDYGTTADKARAAVDCLIGLPT